MKLGKLNDWLQLAAAIGVIFGLGLVAFELRQEHDLVRAQLGADYFAASQELRQAFRDPVAIRAYVKAHEAPGDLTPEEHVILDSLYSEVLEVLVLRNAYMVRVGIFELVDLDEVADDAAGVIFSSTYGREWWTARRTGFFPRIRELMDAAAARELEPSVFDYATLINERVLQNVQE